MSKRMARMLEWIEKNPAELYADYRDRLTNDQAQMILAGDFDGFRESAWESEFQMSDYPEFWDYWESEFASEFGFDSWSDVSDHIKEICYENRCVDAGDFWKTLAGNTDINVVARPVKRSGEYITFPVEGLYADHDDNKARRAYLKRFCGIDLYNGRFSESYYDDTHLVVLGKIDFASILETGKKPTHVWLDSDCFTLGHDNWNGSGTCDNDRYKGKRRKMRAEFWIDGQNGYGVDDTYGLAGDCWSNEIEVA